MSAPPLSTLLTQQTKQQIYAYAISLAIALGLPVSTWQPGDPTRSIYWLESELLAQLEIVVVGFISAGFLDTATGPWLKILAKQVYNVDVPEATFATTTLTLTNGGGGVYDIDPGDLTVKSTTSGKTYHNTSGGHLGAGGTLTLDIEADEAGAASSAGVAEIDTLVTTLLGVTCSNPIAAIGIDEQDEATTRAQCRAKLDSLSPNGAKGAYFFVALNPLLTGTKNVTRCRVYSDGDTGDVTVYLAGPSGGISSGDRAAVEAAIVTWATPLCVTPTVASAANVVVPVTYELWVYNSINKSGSEVQADVLAALEDLFQSPTESPIGGNIIPPATTGDLYVSAIETAIKAPFSQAFRVRVTAPAADVALANNEVAALGAVTCTAINFVADP